MKNQNTSDMAFEDSENFSGSENLSIQQIVLKNLQKCVEEGSKEMSGGGYIRRFYEGEYIEVLVPNQREVFSNSVDMLWILVFPFFLQCKEQEIIDEIESIDSNLKKIDDTSNSGLNEQYKWVSRPTHWSESPKDIQRNNQTYRSHVQKMGIEFKEVFRVKSYRKKLLAISRLLKSLDYFTEGGFTTT